MYQSFLLNFFNEINVTRSLRPPGLGLSVWSRIRPTGSASPCPRWAPTRTTRPAASPQSTSITTYPRRWTTAWTRSWPTYWTLRPGSWRWAAGWSTGSPSFDKTLRYRTIEANSVFLVKNQNFRINKYRKPWSVSKSLWSTYGTGTGTGIHWQIVIAKIITGFVIL